MNSQKVLQYYDLSDIIKNMKCVYYEHKAPTDFEEHLTFSVEMPYTIRIKRFISEDIVPLHYAKTIEILLCNNLCGTLLIQNQLFKLGGNQVFVVPPYTVHSNDIARCDGTLYVLKVSFSDMEQYINIIRLLSTNSISIGQLAYQCPVYDEAVLLVEEMIRNDGNFIYCIGCLTHLFDLLGHYIDSDRTPSNDSVSLKETDIRQLIEWTQQNFKKKITLDSVSNLCGYSRNYFCTRFKEITGMTFFNYLTSVRIENSCLLLRKGMSVSEVCFESGFEDISYFIQVFKKYHKITPKQYAQRFANISVPIIDPDTPPSHDIPVVW